MTMIMPVGGNKIEWSPSDKKFTKLASDGAEVQEKDELLDAAKTHLAANECCEMCGQKMPECGCDKVQKYDDMAVIEIEDAEVPESTEALVEVSEDGVVTEDEEEAVEGDAVSEVKDAVEEVKEAVEKIEEAVLNIDEVSIEVEDEVEDEVENESNVDEVSLEIEDGSDIESEIAGVMGIGNGEVEKEGRMASSNEEFIKLSMVSAPTRKKIVNYWSNLLKFPADYVKLMVKDYEK